MKTTTIQQTRRAKTQTSKQTTREDFLQRLQQQLKNKTAVSGGALVVAALEALTPENPGIKHIAGHHGGAILPFYEHYSTSKLFEGYIHVPNEQIAGFIAKGFANTYNQVGVAIATSGPGATNLITPFYDCYMDSSPVVFITGNVPAAVSGSMAFQEAPIKEMAATVAKNVYYITKTQDIPRILAEAFTQAQEGRPGPIWIDIPKDVQLAKIHPKDITPINKQKTTHKKPDVSRIIQALKQASKPVILAGGGIKMAGAHQELRDFAKKHQIPVTNTLKAKGVYPETDELALRMLGMHGTAYANHAVNETDFLLVIGARFDDRVIGDPNKFASQATIAHIDIQPNGIGADKRQPEIVISADAKSALQALNTQDIQTKNYSTWHQRIHELKKTYPLDYDRTSKALKPQKAIDIIWAITAGKHAIIADVGQHQMWTAQHYASAIPNGFDTSAGSGTMGCSMAQALGSYLARQEAGDETPITVICGDESFMMNPNTLALYEKIQPDITVVVIDNKAEDGTPGGMVRQWYVDAHNNTQLPVKGKQEIVRISQGFGVPALEADDVEQAIKIIESAFSREGPEVISLKVDSQEKCLPMMPPGKTVNEMITYQDNKYT